ncbi:MULTISPECIES: archaeosine synthase [Haloferax]|uniref:Queuine tRNA-ribosyltransferase n=1 Tax=Haloferax massiliensis TaxID=1476858 RepID=A0A0D6JLL1_9EURY|nr:MULTISPECIES: archaeosine synthase [Haloferax]MDS0242911.1 archaeosine synthase [Haloferax sp. S2CR25]MDS0446032.1 archaeosine synthase [Haloferax sp. S2CR25-2]CQR48797.1 Queuine tRNA-ribosyltransferase [Haloferax massiliensis]
MTDYFEVHARDGAARIGELRLSEPVTTPAVADDVLADAGSLWAADREFPDGSDDALTVLPHRSLPAGSADEVRESFAVDYPDAEFPSAAVVTADTAADYGADAYVLSDAQGFVGHARAFRDNVIEAKENLPADTALMLSGVATPRNVSLLVYAGVDLVDEKLARARGLEGFYLTSDGEYFLEDLDELPCACEACRTPASEFTRADAADHNANALRAELARVRRRVRDGRLRDYVEGQARHDQWLTALFRRFDQQYSFMEERVPVIRDSELTAASEESIDRVEIQRFADRVTKRYRNRFDNPLVLLPCSAKKPYSESQSHRQFQEAVQYRAHMVSMTSPIGVVPQELELTYPAQHYDSVVTGDWSEDEKSFVAEVLRRYLERNDYPRIVAHVPPGAYTEIVERVADDLDLDVEFTVSEHPTTTESIGNLMRTLDGEPKFTREEREHNVVKALADYQLGPDAGDALFADVELEMTSRFPKLQVWNDAGVQLATMVPQYGVLSFTLEGAKVWRDSDAPTKTVEIDGFVPHGSVLAPGVVDADADIRPGDEVVVEGPKAFAIGRAEMGGRELVESTRGIGVEIRHVEER